MNGRDNITLLGKPLMPERKTAEALGLSLMFLRRSPSLQRRLCATSVQGHPYYSEADVLDVKAELQGVVMRSKMKAKDKPKTIAERRARGEMVLHGIVCYPKLRNAKRAKGE